MFRTTWDLIQVLLLMYLLIVVPLRLCFEIEVEIGSFAFWFDVGVDVYFLTDIWVNFRTPHYHATTGLLVIDERDIAMNYCKTWLVIDVVTCLPVSYVMMLIHGVEAASDGKSVRMLKVLRLLKLAKLLRITRIVRMLERYREQLRVFMAAFGSIILMSAILVFSHLVACIWYAVGTNAQLPTTETPGVDGWVYRQWGPKCVGETEDHWSVALEGESADVCRHPDQKSKYITAVYWALMTISTVGYGDITAQTDIEMLMTVLAMLFGALVFALITGSLSAKMMSTKGAIQLVSTQAIILGPIKRGMAWINQASERLFERLRVITV